MCRKNKKHPKVAHRCFYRDEVKPEIWVGISFSQEVQKRIRYRALDLEDDLVGEQHVYGFPIYSAPFLNRHEHKLSKIMARTNVEKKNIC